MTSAAKMVQLGEWPSNARAMSGGDLTSVALLSVANSQSATVTGTATILSNSTAVTTQTMQTSADILSIGASAIPTANTYNTVQLVNQGSAFITVFNGAANTLIVFPPAGGTINGQTMNVSFGTIGSGFGVAAAKSTTFITPDGTTWFAAHAG